MYGLDLQNDNDAKHAVVQTAGTAAAEVEDSVCVCRQWVEAVLVASVTQACGNIGAERQHKHAVAVAG